MWVIIEPFTKRGRRVIGMSGPLIWPKTLMELILNLCGEFRWSPEGPVSQIHSPRRHAWCPWDLSDLLRPVQMLKIVWGADGKGKLPRLYITSKTATLVPEFAMENLPLGRISALVPELVVKDLPLGRTLMMIMMILCCIVIYHIIWYDVQPEKSTDGR